MSGPDAIKGITLFASARAPLAEVLQANQRGMTRGQQLFVQYLDPQPQPVPGIRGLYVRVAPGGAYGISIDEGNPPFQAGVRFRPTEC